MIAKSQIVKLTNNNLEDILFIFNQQFKEEAWTKQQILDSLKSNSTQFYGFFENDKIVCIASVLISIDDINLLQIATQENYKRKGYAKKLLSFLLKIKKETQTFSLEVKSKNTPAIALYEDLGFKTLNIRKNYYKDGDNALCMFLQNK